MGAVGASRRGRLADQDIERLRAAVRLFAEAMEQRLVACVDRGMAGWDDEAMRGQLETALAECMGRHLAEGGQSIDLANYLLFLWVMDDPARQARIDRMVAGGDR